jgi:hypothetical protein
VEDLDDSKIPVKKMSKSDDSPASEEDEGLEMSADEGGSIEDELAESAAEPSGEEVEDEDAESYKEEEIVLVPASVRLDMAELAGWFKRFDGLDSYVIFTTSGNDFVELVGLDSAHRISVLSKMPNLETETKRKKLDTTAQIPISNDKESLAKHLNVIGSGEMVDLIFDGKDLTIKCGDDETTFTPDARQVAPSASMKKVFESKAEGDELTALGQTYSNYMVFAEGFSELVARWEKYGREFAAFVIEGKKVTCRFISEMEDLDGKAGATVVVVPKKIVSSGANTIAFTKLSMVPMKKIAAEDEITIHYFSDDHPYIVTTKSGQTMIVVASTIKPKEE